MKQDPHIRRHSAWPVPRDTGRRSRGSPADPAAFPPLILRTKLAGARAVGMDFEQAWTIAPVSAALASVEREAWLTAFEETKGSWRRAYNREPALACDAAASLLREDRETTTGHGARPEVRVPTTDDAHPRMASSVR